MHHILLLILLCGIAAAGAGKPVASRLVLHPVVAGNITSAFTYSYNPSWIEPKAAGGSGCLLTRNQNATSATDPTPGPSFMALVCSTSPADVTTFPRVTEADVVFRPTTPQEVLGTEDPRVALVNGTYYMFYTAVQMGTRGRWIARLSLATTTDPAAGNGNWTRHGAIFPDVDGFQFTKSGALLARDDGVSYLIFGDSTLYNGLQVAATHDLVHYRVLEDYLLIQPRPGKFDARLVESGPPPMRLSNGDYLFIYNGAQPLDGPPNGLFYAPGWVILNGSNPLDVLARSDEPLMLPTYLWEVSGLTPYVIFIEAMRRDPSVSTADTFVVYYGAADTNVGAARVRVDPAGRRVWML